MGATTYRDLPRGGSGLISCISKWLTWPWNSCVLALETIYGISWIDTSVISAAFGYAAVYCLLPWLILWMTCRHVYELLWLRRSLPGVPHWILIPHLCLSTHLLIQMFLDQWRILVFGVNGGPTSNSVTPPKKVSAANRNEPAPRRRCRSLLIGLG